MLLCQKGVREVIVSRLFFPVFIFSSGCETLPLFLFLHSVFLLFLINVPL